MRQDFDRVMNKIEEIGRRRQVWLTKPELPTEPDERKKLPIATGVIDYFPLSFAALAELSRIGNDTHNPGMPLHWSRGKSDDHPDALMRHFIERGKVDVNGVRHSAQVAWRALAILQLELEKAAIDAAEENAWRLETSAFERAPGHFEDKGRCWRSGQAVRARHWPEIPEDAVGLPCDVEPAPHGPRHTVRDYKLDDPLPSGIFHPADFRRDEP